MPWPLFLAIRQLFPGGRRISSFALLSIAGVAIGVGVLILSLSVMNGFQRSIHAGLRDGGGEIHVMHVSGQVRARWHVEKIIEEDPDVLAANAYVEGLLMFQFENHPAFPGVWSIDLADDKQVIPFREKQFIKRGSLEAMDDEHVLLSRGLANRFRITEGDEVEIYTPLMLEKLKHDEVLLPRVLKVAGVYETGWEEMDENTLIVSLRLMQELYNFDEDEAQAFSLRIREGADLDVVCDRLEQRLGQGAVARTWMERHDRLLWVLSMEKGMIFFITLFIVVVASFSLTSMLMGSVIRKTREIGLLGALGATPLQIALVFCFQSVIVTTVGVLLALVVSDLILRNLDVLASTLLDIFGYADVIVEFYRFQQLPVHRSASDLITIIVATYVITLLAALIPALRAACLKPAEALRNE